MFAGIERQQFESDWDELQDPERAASKAAESMLSLRDHREDPVPLLPQIEKWVNPLWDAPNADPKLVVETLEAVEPAFRAAEATVELTSPERLYLRPRLQILKARAWFRYPHERQAFVEALASLSWLEGFVGGPEVLEDVLSRPANPVAEQAVAALGIYPAALRRAGLPQTHIAQFRARGLRLVEAYLRRDGGGVPAIYDRTHALASQWFYLAAHEVEDDDLVQTLYNLDLQTRPRTARGQATKSLREMEFAKRFGTAMQAAAHGHDAMIDLQRFRLVRHQRVVQQRSYVAA